MKNFLPASLLALCLASPALAQNTSASPLTRQEQLAATFRDTLAAAERGDANAQYDLAMMYAMSRGVTRDDEQAMAWLHKAAEHGDADGQVTLATLYAEGRGVPQDDTQAAVWYRKAADQGQVGAQYKLGVMYASGRGVPQDKVQAVAWLRKAADKGLTDARELLHMMETGRGSSDNSGGAVPAEPPTSGGLFDMLKKLDEQQK